MQGRASRFLTLAIAVTMATPCASAVAQTPHVAPDTVVVAEQAQAPHASVRAVPAAAQRAPVDVTLDAPQPGEAGALMQQRRAGQPRAMMIVGAAAFLAGAIIQGTAGTVLMVGGAIIGLVGLYDYLN